MDSPLSRKHARQLAGSRVVVAVVVAQGQFFVVVVVVAQGQFFVVVVVVVRVIS